MFARRFYRDWVGMKNLQHFAAKVRETDLLIACDTGLSLDIEDELRKIRAPLEKYISNHPQFATSLKPVEVDANSPDIVKKMSQASKSWSVGPMAAVAGAIAQMLGKRILCQSKNVIIENGGDIYAKLTFPLQCGLYAGGKSPFTGKIKFEVDAINGIAICTSSGTVGHSLSFGKADAVVAIADDASFADAAATSLANLVRTEDYIDEAISIVERKKNLKGLIVCIGEKIGFWGSIKLLK
mgnify:CR=1 FL=1